MLDVSAATTERMLSDARIAARGGRRRRAGFSSAVRREVPVRTFDDWGDPPPGFCEADLVARGGMSVTGSFIQTLTMVAVATGYRMLPADRARRNARRAGDRASAKLVSLADLRARL